MKSGREANGGGEGPPGEPPGRLREGDGGRPPPDLSPQRLIGRLLGGQYRVEEHLGAGGFGDVFRAVQEKTKQLVALKVLRALPGTGAPNTDRQLARFRREMRVCAELHHPHIVRLIDTGESEEGQLYSVFEYVPGETLADLLETKGALPVETTIEVMSQVLDALGLAHSRGIVHRDLKPNNIMADTSGPRPRVKVLDFGISGFVEGIVIDSLRSLTLTREILGTPAYAAPEQLRGDTPTVKTDLYAWGLVFAECLMGRPVFDGPSAMEIAHRQLSSQPVILPARLQQDRLGTLLRWVLEKDVTRRAGDVALVMERLCESRSFENLVDAHGFFVEDEESLTDRSAEEVSATTGVSPGERQRVTALACVIEFGESQRSVGELDAALDDLQALCGRIAHRFGGEVAGRLGGQVLIYFGAPQTSDSDVRRAAIAALEIALEIRRRNPAQDLEFRIGIETGTITAAAAERRAFSATAGVTPGRAVQLAQLAPANGILTGAACYRHLGPSFEFRSNEPLGGEAVYQLLGESRAESAAPRFSQVPLIGRGRELEVLKQACERAGAGQGGTVLILGEPGMGKSRLVAELRRTVASGTIHWLGARCLPETQHSALAPVVELLLAELVLASRSEDRDRQLEVLLAQIGLDPATVLPLIAPWLGISLPDGRRPAISPQKQKAMVLDTLVALTLAFAKQHGSPIVVEDLHWADPTTLELVDLLVDRCAQGDTLLVLTARPDVERRWPAERARTIHLQSLPPPEVERIVRELVGREFVSPWLVFNVTERAEGNPFFIEELTHFLNASLEQPTLGGPSAGAAPSGVPTRLRDILARRLDELGPAKQAAQVAAVIGREVDYSLLAAALPKEESSLLADLEKMVSVDILIRRRHVDSANFMFRHALLRDAAYDSLTARAREQIHRTIAAALVSQFSEVVTRRPEIVADHYSRGLLPAQAVDHWERAGQLAIAKFAHAEAISHYANAIEQQLKLPPSPERSRREMDLRTAVGLALMTTKGYSAREVEETYRRAAELCEELGDELPIRVLYGTWVVNIVRADPGPVARLIERFKQIEAAGRDDQSVLIARISMQAGIFWYPDYRGSLELGEKARALVDVRAPKAQHELLLRDFGFEGLFYAWSYAAYAAVITGALSQGRALMSEGLALAEGVGDPYALATLRSFGILINVLLDDIPTARAFADELRQRTEENSFLLWKAFAQVPRGRMMVADNEVEEGLREIGEGIAILRGVGAMLSFPVYLGIFAEALIELDRLDEAERACNEGLEMVAANGFRAYQPLLLRSRAEVMLRRGDRAAAEGLLDQSLELARQQGALLFQLLTATSLARLHRDAGEPGRGRDLLAQVLASFDGTSQEPVLLNARRLLVEL
jgi:TOMM system kinase/cyclase fusion protein